MHQMLAAPKSPGIFAQLMESIAEIKPTTYLDQKTKNIFGIYQIRTEELEYLMFISMAASP